MIALNAQNTEHEIETDVILKDFWIASQYKNYSIRISDGLLETSTDNSNSFDNSINFVDANKVYRCYAMKNGNFILVTYENKVYLTDINLTSVVEKTIYESDGVTPYTLHTPANASFPGAYFYSGSTVRIYDETDTVCWGNYGNVGYGAAPINIYYTTDFGETIKIAYSFGQNTWVRDDGTDNGSNSETGNLLGDSSNNVVCRHIHNLFYSPMQDIWYATTGDREGTETNGNSEIHWLKGKYDSFSDTWDWSVIDFGFEIKRSSQLKVFEAFTHGKHIYYSTDITHQDGSSAGKSGIWRCEYNVFTDIVKHEQLVTIEDGEVLLGFVLNSDTGTFTVILGENATAASGTHLRTYNLFGNELIDDFEFAGFDLISLGGKNEDGYYLVMTKIFSALHGSCILIKPGYNFNA